MLKEVIYTLKREFASTVTFVSNEKQVRDLDAEQIETSSSSYEVSRPVVLPKQLRPLATNQLAENQRAILIDVDDIWFEVDLNYKVEFDEVVWDIVKIIKHENQILEIIIQHV